MLVDDSSHNAVLALSDGSFYGGYSKGYSGNGESEGSIYSVGEIVFNTSLTGYQEILTDPSYHSQIINFTYPHIGNTGVNLQDEEADEICISGMVARAISPHCSSWRAAQTLPDYLRQRKIIALDGVDTRAVTRRLREGGALGACLMTVPHPAGIEEAAAQAVARARAFSGLSGMLLADSASWTRAPDWREGEWRQQGNEYAPAGGVQRRVAVLDCGVKKNILRALTARGCQVHVLPYDADYQTLQASRPDGVLVSNGPGDPAPCDHACGVVKQLVADKMPVFGLCLGHQVVAAAIGAGTEKMKFGHHGANHPVQELESGRVLITSQNHGFAVRGDTLPSWARITHRSLFDGTLQGFMSESPPLITFQGHPEASPGPHDAARLFDQFVRLIDSRKVKGA